MSIQPFVTELKLKNNNYFVLEIKGERFLFAIFWTNKRDSLEITWYWVNKWTVKSPTRRHPCLKTGLFKTPSQEEVHKNENSQNQILLEPWFSRCRSPSLGIKRPCEEFSKKTDRFKITILVNNMKSMEINTCQKLSREIFKHRKVNEAEKTNLTYTQQQSRLPDR